MFIKKGTSVWSLAQSSTKRWMDKLFMSNGFKVEMIHYGEVATNLGKELASSECEYILFVAEHLRFSDDQVRQIQWSEFWEFWIRSS